VADPWARGLNMKSHLVGLVAIVALFGGSSVGATTYNISDGTASLGVTGTITTDGTIGVLSAANITDWNLLLNIGSSNADLTGPLSGNNSSIFASIGNDLSASATGLFFNFGDTSAFGVFSLRIPDGSASLASISLLNQFVEPGSPEITLFVTPSFGVIGEQGLAQIGAVGATPLPDTLPLFATGLGLIGMLGWWRRRRGVAPTAMAGVA
jgi:hypothetical protein